MTVRDLIKELEKYPPDQTVKQHRPFRPEGDGTWVDPIVYDSDGYITIVPDENGPGE